MAFSGMMIANPIDINVNDKFPTLKRIGMNSNIWKCDKKSIYLILYVVAFMLAPPIFPSGRLAGHLTPLRTLS